MAGDPRDPSARPRVPSIARCATAASFVTPEATRAGGPATFESLNYDEAENDMIRKSCALPCLRNAAKPPFGGVRYLLKNSSLPTFWWSIEEAWIGRRMKVGPLCVEYCIGNQHTTAVIISPVASRIKKRVLKRYSAARLRR